MAAHRYWRLYFTAATSGQTEIALSNVELFENASQIDVTSASTPVTASSIWSSVYNGSATVDSNETNTGWLSASSIPAWIAFDLGTPKDIVGFSITTWQGRTPTKFAIQSSDNGIDWPIFFQNIPTQSGLVNGVKYIYWFDLTYIGGNAKIDNGARADLVRVYNWDAPAIYLGSVIPGTDGAWSLNVPSNTNCLVVISGPTGYQPISHGPVLAVSD